MSIHQKLKYLRLKKGLSLEQVGEAIGVSWQTIQQWENGKTAPKRTRLDKVAGYYGVSAAQLLNDGLSLEEEIENTVNSNIEDGPDIKGNCPLISFVQAGKWAEIVDNFQPGDAEAWIPCPAPHSKNTFVLRVRGESMLDPTGRHTFSPGDLIFVDPEKRAENGSLVVIRLEHEKEATFKKLIIDGEKRFIKAINPDWPNPIQEITEEAIICGVVICKSVLI